MAGTVRVDLGCGASKREGYVGLDAVAAPGVDHVLDLTADRYPFDDDSVDEVYSAHFLEHIPEPSHVFGEIARICKDGARIEFWTPYAFSDDAFAYGHLQCITEATWHHFCVSQRDAHAPMLGGRWLLHRVVYVVPTPTVEAVRRQRIGMDFAVRHLKGIAYEIGAEMEFRADLATPAVEPERCWSTSRFGERQALAAEAPRGLARRAMARLRRRG